MTSIIHDSNSPFVFEDKMPAMNELKQTREAQRRFEIAHDCACAKQNMNQPPTNGGVVCDTTQGPCACGAWHRTPPFAMNVRDAVNRLYEKARSMKLETQICIRTGHDSVSVSRSEDGLLQLWTGVRLADDEIEAFAVALREAASKLPKPEPTRTPPF